MSTTNTLEWPTLNDLVWVHSHHSIQQDLKDTHNISKYIISRIINNDLYDTYIKSFIKWIHLILDNIIHHYFCKHTYYFPMIKLPICEQLKHEYSVIKDIIDTIYKEHKHIKKIFRRFDKNNKQSRDTMIESIHTIDRHIKHLLHLIRINFNKEYTILIPKIMNQFTYAEIRSLDIKIGLRARWYALPHLYRSISKDEYTDHIIRILQLPKITRDTVVAIQFKRYKLEYIPIIQKLLPNYRNLW